MRGHGQFINLGNATDHGATAIVDASDSNVQSLTLNQATTALSVQNLVDGEFLILNLVQDATGGRLVTFNGAGGMTILNPVTLADGPNRTTTVVIAGTNAQGGSLGAVVSAFANGSTAQSYISNANGYVTIANDATAPNGISLDVLVGDAIRARIAGTTYMTISDFVGGCRLDTGALAAYFYGGIVQFTSLAQVVLNAQAASFIALNVGATERFRVDATGMGFFAKTPVAKPTVAGVRTGTLAELQTVVGNLLAALDSSAPGLGLLTNTTT